MHYTYVLQSKNEACHNEKDGFARERYLKSGQGKRYLKNRLKNFFVISLVFFTFAFIAPPKVHAGLIFKLPSSLGLSTGLVGHWTFDGSKISGSSALDSSSSANHGTITGATKTIGKLGQALKFDGSSNYISLATDLSPNQTQFSMSAWIMPHNITLGTAQPIFNEVWTDDCGNEVFQVFIYEGDIGAPGMNVALRANNAIILDPSITLNLNQWYHIAAVFDSVSDVHKIYVNGTGYSVSSAQSTLNNLTVLGEIGGNHFCSTYFDGSIDDVRIYNRALSASEIKRLYNMGQGMKINTDGMSNTTVNKSPTGQLTDGLVGYWTFDGKDISGATVADKSPIGGSNGTIVGPTKTIGKIGQGLNLDPLTYMSFADSSIWTWTPVTQPRTLSLWFYPTSNPAIGSGFNFIYTTAAANNRYQFLYANNGGTLGLAAAIYNVDWAVVGYFGATWTPTLNQWYHIVFVAGTDGNEVYVNGVPYELVEISWNDNSETNPSAIALTSSTASSGSGRVDEMRWYNRALSAEEVGRLYQMGR